MNTPVTVLHVVGPLGWGGAEQQVCELTAGHDPNIVRPIVCTLGPVGPRAEWLTTRGVEVMPVEASTRSIRRDTARLGKIALQKGAALVHAHTATNGTWGQLVGRSARIPVVFSDYGFNSIRSFKQTFLEKSRTRSAARVIANSHALRDEIVARTGVPADRVVTIHSGIDPHRFDPSMDGSHVRARLGVSDDAVLVGTVGRVEKVKGHGHLLEAAATIARAEPQTHLLVLRHQASPLENSLRVRVAELGLESRFHFASPREAGATSVEEVLAALDIFVLPSLSESLPISILEAMAMATPVVATEVGGVAEVVVDGTTGLLVPPRDPSALALAIGELGKQPELRHQMSTAARARVEESFTTGSMVAATEQVYRSLLDDVTVAQRSGG